MLNNKYTEIKKGQKDKRTKGQLSICPFVLLSFCLLGAPCVADEYDDASAAAVAAYELDGSLFQQITDLEQQKILMQLEKERAQLDLELDRLAAEKIKLHMEIDTLEGRSAAQADQLESEKARLAAEAAKLEKQKEQLQSSAPESKDDKKSAKSESKAEESAPAEFAKKYKLIEIIGAGRQLQATVEDLTNNQRRKTSVGKVLDGYTIKSISLDEGVVFSKDGKTETLNVGKEK
ncbi:MAG: hypothetical protein LBJ18_02440 [Rickettsiales bacterium]|jgi:type IV pilus biogenesis protein PilP|nr:hypothetical protein [Rickettsiales bacterium]